MRNEWRVPVFTALRRGRVLCAKRGTEPKPSPPMRVTPASVIGEELSSPATEAASPDLRFPTEDEDHSLRALAIRFVDQLLE